MRTHAAGSTVDAHHTSATAQLAETYAQIVWIARARQGLGAVPLERRVVRQRRRIGRIILISSPACSPEDTALHASSALATGNSVTFLSIGPPDRLTYEYLTAIRGWSPPESLLLDEEDHRASAPEELGVLVCATPRGIYEVDGSFSPLGEGDTAWARLTEFVDLYARPAVDLSRLTSTEGRARGASRTPQE